MKEDVKYFNFRTDMADERVDSYKKENKLENIDGVVVNNKSGDGYKTTIVDIQNASAKEIIGKDIGKYITIEVDNMEYLEEDKKQSIIKEVSSNITNMLTSLDNNESDKKKSVMLVGLGNDMVTPDALGPKVASSVTLTRHLLKYAKEYIDANTREISAISPGVLGTTGIETYEIINSLVENIKPNLVIAIDSLASLSVDRLGKTIQISTTGITPGAGVNNKRVALNKESLGINVFAIGVPTVVDMATITNEAIDKLIESGQNLSQDNINNDKSQRYKLISDVLNTENYIVTPKEIDAVIVKISEIIASALNVAL